ncbi:MAG: T9SS type A sorting domain-containing protein, partial [Bacteroidetes bacterium]|nr:T9SS type A sorting domain-containing protein [Bacteroidota bacterium]
MKNKTFGFIAMLSFLLASGVTIGQTNNFWKEATSQRTAQLDKELRNSMPTQYSLLELNTTSFASVLLDAPSRKLTNESTTIISLPTDQGKLQDFKVLEASVFSDDLKAQFPQIKSYVAQGITDPSAIARFSVSPGGVHVMISSPKYKTIYIDPYTTNKQFYIHYSKKDVPSDPNSFECQVENTVSNYVEEGDSNANKNADDGMLRTFRLALAGTGEYSTFHWNNQGVPNSADDATKKAAVLVGMNTTMTRVNGVFERDVALTMEIIGNNTDIIYLNSGSDPYTNNDPFALLGENQANLDAVIGNANYDIGHVFSTQGGGVAQLNSPCVNGLKAQGVTGIPTPIGDFYDIDYVAHEMGHQFGANHPQNNNCQRSSVSIEPGSASTIMGYAGICAPNVQNNSDDYFNGVSIIEMWNNISGGASTCAAQTATNNDPPEINNSGGFFIPPSTPFVLSGDATDPNSGDVLTYCWEQVDTTPAPMPPVNTSTAGPLFRSLDPNISPDRYMPALPTVVGGATQSTWEVVPTVQRSMAFRLTVRDNVLNGGASASELIGVTTIGGTGPFVVTSQATNEDWVLGSEQTVTWDVAGTDAAPISAANVDIIVSLDGGVSFDTAIVSGVPNNGSATFTVPNIPNTTEARVMVKASDNLFYNINPTDFTISGVAGVNDVLLNSLSIAPNPSYGQVAISFVSLDSNLEVALYDMKGRKLTSEIFEVANGVNVNRVLNYDSYASGMYFVKITNGSATATKKLI